MRNFYRTVSLVFLSLFAFIGVVFSEEQPTSYISDCTLTNFWDCFWIEGEALYWKVREEEVARYFGTAHVESTVSDSSVITTVNEHDHELNFDWELGFRLGMGLNCNCWQTALYWTHFHDRAKGSFCHNRASSRLKYDTIDLLFGYPLFFNTCIVLTPFFGARYAEIRQSLCLHLEAEIIDLTDEQLLVTLQKDNVMFWGLGPQIGFEAEYFIGCGLSLYGNLNGNVLYSDCRLRHKDSNSSMSSENVCFLKKKSSPCQFGVDFGLGARYHLSPFFLQIGLEHHTYFDFDRIGCGNDLNLYGVQASAGFCF